ncbi:MAG TPA: aspartyl protease family protein [Candidatus Acidoferrum sp.]|nr:aspartyl protease family protein [Candidatus Acidoferrum sp.]
MGRLASLLSVPCVALMAVYAPSVRAQNASNGSLPEPPAAAACRESASEADLPAEPLAKALRLYRAGDFDAATESYRTLIAAGTDPAAAYAGLARVYLREKSVDDAFAAASKAIDLAPTLPAANVAMGEVYFRQGELQKAERAFLVTVRACQADARAYYGLGRVYRVTSNYRRARIAIEKAHSLDPDDPDIREAWMETLPRAERVKYLKDYLASNAASGDEERENLEAALALLQDDADGPANACRLISDVSSTESKLDMLLYDPTHVRGYGLKVLLNGTPANLLLDTGSSGILVDRRVAEKAHIKPLVEHEARGVGDAAPPSGYIGYVDAIKVGGLEFRGCRVEVVERTSVADSDGLIGGDVFSHFLVELNFPDAKFKLTPLPPVPEEPGEQAALESRASETVHLHDRYIAPEMESYLRVFRFGHALLIPTRLNGSVTKLFLIDTGAFDDTVSPRAAKEVTKISPDGQTHVHGLNGSVKQVYRANKVTLQFGHFEQKREDLITFDLTSMSDGFGTEISGTLGFAMLQLLDIRIDYRDGLVDFRYDPNRFH